MSIQKLINGLTVDSCSFLFVFLHRFRRLIGLLLHCIIKVSLSFAVHLFHVAENPCNGQEADYYGGSSYYRDR